MGVAITDDGRFARAERDSRSRLGRVELQVPVQLWSHDGGWLQGLLRNLSIGGMFVATARTFPIGTRVRARFSGARGREPNEIEARVTWARQVGTDEGPAGIGVAFVGPMVRAAIFVRVLLRSRPPNWG